MQEGKHCPALGRSPSTICGKSVIIFSGRSMAIFNGSYVSIFGGRSVVIFGGRSVVIFGGRSVAVFGVSLWTDLVIKSMTIFSLLCLEGRSPFAYQSNIEYAREGSIGVIKKLGVTSLYRLG